MSGLKGSYSVSGGPTKHVGSGSMKRPATTTTSTYQKKSVVKPSQGIAQAKTAPIKDAPKISKTGSEDNYLDRDIPTTTMTTTTETKDSKPVSIEKKFGTTIKTRAQKLRDALYY